MIFCSNFNNFNFFICPVKNQIILLSKINVDLHRENDCDAFCADDVPERRLRPVLQLGSLWLWQRTAAAAAKLSAFLGAHVPQYERQRVHEHDHGL